MSTHTPEFSDFMARNQDRHLTSDEFPSMLNNAIAIGVKPLVVALQIHSVRLMRSGRIFYGQKCPRRQTEGPKHYQSRQP